mmetsp:Transcript_19377/g.32230  ORF Transcript_19377/g.32230 Transcript_19377/m.32230 type:complete len:154 (+) Transcript_19377:58-519(+)
MATGFVVAPCPGFHRLKLSVNRKHSRGFCEQPLAELTSSKDGTKQQHRSMRMPRRTFGVSAALIIGSAATFSFRSSQANAQEEELCLAEEKGICKPTASQGSVQLSILGSRPCLSHEWRLAKMPEEHFDVSLKQRMFLATRISFCWPISVVLL